MFQVISVVCHDSLFLASLEMWIILQKFEIRRCIQFYPELSFARYLDSWCGRKIGIHSLNTSFKDENSWKKTQNFPNCEEWKVEGESALKHPLTVHIPIITVAISFGLASFKLYDKGGYLCELCLLIISTMVDRLTGYLPSPEAAS